MLYLSASGTVTAALGNCQTSCCMLNVLVTPCYIQQVASKRASYLVGSGFEPRPEDWRYWEDFSHVPQYLEAIAEIVS